jgi:NtrC-family two-component system response regulator AlgB
LGQLDPEADFPTASAAMQRQLNLARQVAPSSATVLICGEPGTGKGRLARAIHAWSGRASSPLAVVACESSDPDALEAELFGTSPSAGVLGPDRPGRITFAESGTLLLEEVGQTPPSLQPRMLRLVSQKEYERMGDFRTRRANVRFIATSSFDLQEAAKRRRLRPELLLALEVVRIDLPPLRERPEDVKLLAGRYLAHFARENHRSITGISPEAMHALRKHGWPGNTRELRNVMERAVLLCDGELVGPRHLPPNLLAERQAHAIGDLVPLEKIEGMHIRSVLSSAGTIKGAAAILGINPSTLARWLKRTEAEGDRGSETNGADGVGAAGGDAEARAVV